MLSQILRWMAKTPIYLYQWTIRPLIGNCCRFYPSCSNYALEAIERFGIFYGTWLIVKRLIKCGPWHKGGVDFVPTQVNAEESATLSQESKAPPPDDCTL